MTDIGTKRESYQGSDGSLQAVATASKDLDALALRLQLIGTLCTLLIAHSFSFPF